jgi:hypothetical protein
MCERGADGSRTVTQLDLSENNLSGRIPDTSSELAHLDTLIIFGNHLSGRLPDVIVERWLDGALWVTAETPLLTDVSLMILNPPRQRYFAGNVGFCFALIPAQ